jgi:hypothetical protein
MIKAITIIAWATLEIALKDNNYGSVIELN